ncbi:MAG: 2,3-butanediol dehydrogenase [Deltaproteobacteria bacterium]|nr:2,3-butanediol dehydrogenase [Deltaproteobacteria bacterium]
MKAAKWFARKEVRVVNVPEPPAPPKGWVKVKVHACGICGSDLHEYLAGPIFIPTSPHPLTGHSGAVTLGHEFSGDIAEVGPGVANFKAGDRVTGDACQYCGECYYCKRNLYNLCTKIAFTGLMIEGAFAEYVNVPAYTLYKLPDSVSYDAGALVEPLAVGIHAMRQGNVLQGDSVVIVGAGTIGLVNLVAARAAGASQVISIEKARARKELAKQLGATMVLDPSEVDVIAEVQKATGGLGADVSIECVGHKVTGPLAIDLARKAGTVVIVGIFEEPSEYNFFNITATEKKIVGSLAYAGEFDAAISLLADGRINPEPLITGRIKLDDIVEKGFEELVNRKEENIKILVMP